MKKRREYLVDSMDIYCSGSDRRLAALKKRYKDNRDVMHILNQFDEHIEP
jgi:hypothetical protein